MVEIDHVEAFQQNKYYCLEEVCELAHVVKPTELRDLFWAGDQELSGVDKNIDLTNLQWLSGQRKVNRLASVAITGHPAHRSTLVEQKNVNDEMEDVVVELETFGVEGLSMGHQPRSNNLPGGKSI